MDFPDVHFWVGKGKPGPDGTRISDETGGETPLIKSEKKTMVLTLPGDLTVFDIGKNCLKILLFPLKWINFPLPSFFLIW